MATPAVSLLIDNPTVSEDFTRLVDRWEGGDRSALDAMTPVIYAGLKHLARVYLRRERPDHTLQPTALVHEAYLSLIEQRQVDWRNRAQSLGVAAGAMRRVLLHHAEKRKALKRDGALDRVTLDDGLATIEQHAAVDILDLHRALEQLAALDARQARVVELRVFGGLNVAEIAEVLGISAATVKRDWSVARLWLRRALT